MTNKNPEKKLIPPYLPYKTLDNFIERLKIGMPSRIDRSLMGTLSGAAQTQILTTLKFLKLITGNGTPTDNLSKLASASDETEKQRILKNLLESAYPLLFQDHIDLEKVTPHQLNEFFTQMGTSGGTTQKSIAFFLAMAQDAGLKISPHIKTRGAMSSVSRSKRKTQNKVKQSSGTGLDESGASEQIQNISWQQLLLSKFPSFDPEWSDETKKKWFDGFKGLMDEFKRQSEEESQD